MDKEAPSVTSVVLNWNNAKDTAACVKSLQNLDYDNHNVVIVDNGSTDKSVETLQSQFSSVTLLENAENRGFAGGMNTGIQHALDQGVEYIWILNNDALVPDDQPAVLNGLVDRMERNDAIGILTPIVQRYPDIDEVWFARGEVNWQVGTTQHRQAEISGQDVFANDYIPLCCALVRTDVFQDVGLLSDTYFVYTEDVDFAIRTLAAGYLLVTDTTLGMYHRGSAASGGVFSRLFSYYKSRNLVLLHRKFNNVFTGFWLRYLWWLSTRAVYRVANGSIGGALAMFQGALDGIRGYGGRGPYP